MGYTHQYNATEFRPDEWLDLCQDTRQIIAAAESHGIPIRGWDGTGEPEVGEGRIAFNGDAETGQDHETFAINAGPRSGIQADLDELDADPEEYPAKQRIRAVYEKKLADLDGGDGAFGFCKTNQKPYDAAVCAVIIRARHRNPTFTYRSDGNWEDWRDGADMCRRLWPDDEVKDEVTSPRPDGRGFSVQTATSGR